MPSNLCNDFQFMGMDSSFEDSDIVVFGAPFDGTTSFRPGTRFASKAMRPEFIGLETYSPKLQLDLVDCRVHDGGEMYFPLGDVQTVLNTIETTVSEIVQAGKKPCMIGGEHLVTLPAVKAVLQAHPNAYIFHFDAHTDLRDELDGAYFSHATVIRRIHDIVGDERIFQFGIRSGMKSEFDFALQDQHTYMEPFQVTTVAQQLEKLAGEKVYITIDLDILDPSIFPGTGTPEAGGITYRELESVFAAFQAADVELVGADLVELSPDYDHSGVSTAVANKVLREIILLLNKKANLT